MATTVRTARRLLTYPRLRQLFTGRTDRRPDTLPSWPINASWEVRQLEPCLNWYRDMLGFEVLQHWVFPGSAGRRGVRLYLDTIVIELHEAQPEGSVNPCPSDEPMDLTIPVPCLAQAIGRLQVKGANLAAGPFVDYEQQVTYCFIRSADTHTIKLLQSIASA